MTRRTRWRPGASLVALLSLAALVALGCAEANPLPSPGGDTGGTGGLPDEQNDGRDGPPAPGADEYAYLRGELTFVSSLKADQGDDSVVVVGAPGAASHDGPIQLTAAALGLDVTVQQDAGGGFATQIDDAFVGLEFTLTLLPDPDDPDSDPQPADLDLVVRAVTGDLEPSFYFGAEADGAGEAPAGAPDPSWDEDDNGAGVGRSGYVYVTAPDEDGEAHLLSAALGVSPFARVIVWNTTDGRSHVGFASNDGELDLAFAAESGDLLSVFAASPSDAEATTEAISLTVP